MKIKKLVYSDIAAQQFIQLFNEAYGTHIVITSEVLDGTCSFIQSLETPQLIWCFWHRMSLASPKRR